MKKFLSLLVPCLFAVCFSPVMAQPPVDKAEVNAAIDRGVQSLKRSHQNGLWKYQTDDFEKNIGVTALAGLALLESDVKPDDPLLKLVTQNVVAAVPKLSETYTISLALLFLDRQGREQTPHPHASHIRLLAEWLKKGQFQDGWSYGGRYNAPTPDNSNTQFAILALWVARKHGVRDVDRILLRAAERFRKSHQPDGGWGYGLKSPGGGDASTNTMTCAGLLGLFLEFGAKRDVLLKADSRPGEEGPVPAAPPPVQLNDIRNDPMVKEALRFLGQYVGPSVRADPHRMYFLWSVERVGVTYDIKTINNVNWYDWGTAFLLPAQKRDGSWIEENGAPVDTAFALLFLRRANIVGQIETRLRQVGPESPPPPRGRAADSPPAGRQVAVDPEVAKLVQDLVKADAQKQLQLIDAYQSERGAAYTKALGEAIPNLRESVRDKARLALVERLRRETTDALREHLKDPSAEIRRAAATAASRRAGSADALIPDLIAALGDADPAMRGAAHESLKSISGKQFDKDPKPWTDWWKARGSR